MGPEQAALALVTIGDGAALVGGVAKEQKVAGQTWLDPGFRHHNGDAKPSGTGVDVFVVGDRDDLANVILGPCQRPVGQWRKAMLFKEALRQEGWRLGCKGLHSRSGNGSHTDQLLTSEGAGWAALEGSGCAMV
jgi:hypothetical protein